MTVLSQDTISIDQIVWDSSVYPRSRWNTATVERYAEAMEAGDEFPPLVLEAGTNRLLDGKHRELAYRKAGISVVPVEWHDVPDGHSPKHYAAILSARHGDRVSSADLKALAREEFESNPEASTVEWGRDFGVPDRTVRFWVSDIIDREMRRRQAAAWRLWKLGWTQQEIGERFGVTQGRISQDINNGKLADFNSRLPNDWNAQSVADEAIRSQVPLCDAFAAALQSKPDLERFELLEINAQPYDVWNFHACHDLMGDAHPGRIPGELVCHVLYFFTKPGQLVIDPMAGSGTTLDACILMGRKARGYDIDLHHERVDIEQHDLTNGWPESVQKAALVFWDPPYFHKVDDGYVDGSVSRLQANDYLCFFEHAFAQLREVVKPSCRLAFLMADWDGEHAATAEDKAAIFIWDYADLLRKTGWQLLRHIQVPLPTQQIHPDIVVKFRESRRLARLERYLLIAEPA